MRIQPWTLAAVALPLFTACSHAKPAVKAEAPASPPPMAMTAPAEAPLSPALPAARSCISDDQCDARELCVSAKCTAITPQLAECKEVSAHFDYDRADLQDVDLPVLQRIARCFQALPPEPTLVSGNCDERGTVAYNIVLGLRRAHAVARYLERLGVPEKQLTEVSYGKELGICDQHDEACWLQNRRADVARGEHARDVAALIRADEQRERAALAKITRPAKGPALAVGRRTPVAKHAGTRAKAKAAAPETTAPAK